MTLRALVLLLVTCAVLRHAIDARPRPATSVPARIALPSALDGERGRTAPLAPSERLLAAREGVSLSRLDYGQSRVALTTTIGVKELHPPEACLRAAGNEIVTRHEEPLPLGCALRYEVRRPGGAAAWLYVAYLEEGRAGASCSSLARLGRAALRQLAGRPRVTASLEVMDRDRRRARERLNALLAALAPRA